MRGRDARGYAEADRDFHEAIVAATGNEILTTLYRSLRDRQLRMGVVNLLEERTGELDHAGVARMRANIADHEAILAGISHARDPRGRDGRHRAPRSRCRPTARH